VKANVVLARLLELRRRGEQRALERLIAREGDCHNGQRRVDEAADAALRQMAKARAQERQEIESFRGEAVPQRAILRFYEKLDAMMLEHARLRVVEETACKALREHEEARAKAQRELRACQRATTKLDAAVKKQSIDTALRQAAFTEAADEERVRTPPALRSPDGHGA
jgi:hypothetical protein